MNVLVIGCGLQGRAVGQDLAASEAVGRITCADANLDVAQTACRSTDSGKLRAVALNASNGATGLMAMNRTVGFPASIAAQTRAGGQIKARGLPSPIQHMPWTPLVEQLSSRGIAIVESVS